MLSSASIRAQEFRHGTRPLSNSTATQRPKRLVSLLAFSFPIPRAMRQGLGSNAYFKASRFISKRLVDAKTEVWSRLGSALGQFETRVGHVVGVSVVHRDISERKRSERDLRQMHQWLEMAQEAGDVAPWAYDPKTGEVRWTKQLYRQLGYGSDEITPSLSAFRERVHPDDQMGLDDIREQEFMLDRSAIAGG